MLITFEIYFPLTEFFHIMNTLLYNGSSYARHMVHDVRYTLAQNWACQGPTCVVIVHIMNISLLLCGP